MTFTEAVATCLRKYATFRGTASRSEFWWFFLFLFLANIATGLISETLGLVFTAATLIPSLASACRRLHDTDRSGWWQLLYLVPLIGPIFLVVFWAQAPRPNRYAVGIEAIAR